jgi:hypothetical protein
MTFPLLNRLKLKWILLHMVRCTSRDATRRHEPSNSPTPCVAAPLTREPTATRQPEPSHGSNSLRRCACQPAQRVDQAARAKQQRNDLPSLRTSNPRKETTRRRKPGNNATLSVAAPLTRERTATRQREPSHHPSALVAAARQPARDRRPSSASRATTQTQGSAANGVPGLPTNPGSARNSAPAAGCALSSSADNPRVDVEM